MSDANETCTVTYLDDCGLGNGLPRVQLSCVNLNIHFFFGLFCCISGVIAGLSRCWPKTRVYHKRLGAFYFYCMIALMYTSLWSRSNGGFSVMIFIFGVLDYGGLVLGHYMITNVFKRPAITSFNEKESSEEQSRSSQELSPVTLEDGKHSESLAESVTEVERRNAERVKFLWMTPTRKTVKYIHGAAMCLSVFQTCGAGFFFVRRSEALWDCKDIIFPDTS